VNDYYDPTLKYNRLAQLQERPGFRFHKLDLADRPRTAELFRSVQPQRVIHLAAQAGVRYSLTNPHAYIDGNLVAFANVLEGCRHQTVAHLNLRLIQFGLWRNTRMPFSVHDMWTIRFSLYAPLRRLTN